MSDATNNNEANEEMEFESAGGMQYSNISLDEIKDTEEFTLVNIAVDTTGSVHLFLAEIQDCVESIITNVKKHNRSENLLVRVSTFDEKYNDNVREYHGYKLPSTISQTYVFQTGGMTPLKDAYADSLVSIKSMAKKLYEDDHMCNAVSYIITDGADNSRNQSYSIQKLKDAVDELKSTEELLTFQSFLIGINDSQYKGELEQFQKDVSIDQYKSAGEVNSNGLGNIGDWISEHIEYFDMLKPSLSCFTESERMNHASSSSRSVVLNPTGSCMQPNINRYFVQQDCMVLPRPCNDTRVNNLPSYRKKIQRDPYEY